MSTPLKLKDTNIVDEQNIRSSSKIRPPSAVKRSAKILPLDDELNEIESSAEPLLKKLKINDENVALPHALQKGLQSKLPKPGAKCKAFTIKTCDAKITQSMSKKSRGNTASTEKTQPSRNVAVKDASKGRVTANRSANGRSSSLKPTSTNKISNPTQPRKKVTTARAPAVTKPSINKKAGSSMPSSKKQPSAFMTDNSQSAPEDVTNNWEDLGSKLIKIQNEIGKHPKWDMKSRMGIYDKGFGLLTTMHETYTQATQNREGQIDVLVEVNKKLQTELRTRNDSEVAFKQKEDKLQQDIQTLQDENSNIKKKHEYETELLKMSKENLQRESESLNNQLSAARVECNDLQQTNARLTEKVVSVTAEFNSVRSKLENLQRENENLNNQLSVARCECTSLQQTVARMLAETMSITAEFNAVRCQLEAKCNECQRLNGVVVDLKEEVKSCLKIIDEKELEIRNDEALRRQLHNQVQELKGNIRVFCRIRPLLNDQSSELCPPHISFNEGSDTNIKLIPLNQSEDVAGAKKCPNKYDFSFDKVFRPNCSQEDVFFEVSQLIQSVLDGYNVCIFAYGQTGSGKTYTMEGPPCQEGEIDCTKMGIIPKAVAQIFVSAKELQEKGWKYNMEASFLEIYNETVRDLLGNNRNVKHEIKITNDKKDVMVTNLSLVDVNSEKQVHKLLVKASHNRAVAATECNEYSSRSHSLFRLKLNGENSITGENCEGTLNLIDLAGSERVFISGSTGDRLTEAKNINKSLSSLGQVILALANKESHIPYRNSKLTYLLQNSLGGNSKTLMFVNISPSPDCFQESLNSLRFATKVNNCQIGTATKKLK